MGWEEPLEDMFKFEVRADNPLVAGASALAFSTLERLLQLHQLREIYGEVSRQGGQSDFVERALEALNVNCVTSEQDMASIPSSGPLIVVANHPFGGVEGMLLASVLRKVRPDVKIPCQLSTRPHPGTPFPPHLRGPPWRQNSRVKEHKRFERGDCLDTSGGCSGCLPGGRGVTSPVSKTPHCRPFMEPPGCHFH